MVNEYEEQIERLIQAVNEIADLIPTSAEAAPTEFTAQPGSLGGLPLEQVVDANIGRILGANPSKDPQRIVALLTGAFEKRPGASAGDYQWRQRGSVPIEGSVGGQISGEQATLYQELKDREEAANRLLDSVVPVILGPDEDEINEVKDRIRTTLSSVVAESGRPGGALLDKIDVLLQTLDSDLRELKGKLGLDEDNQLDAELRKVLDVATAEQIKANFESLEATYIGSGTLGGVRARLADANDSPGTRLSRLLRSTEAIPNTVQQAYIVMNSVRFGAAERRVIGVESDSDTTTFEQLFNWIEQSASADWPTSLIGGGAKRSEIAAVKLAAQRQSDKLNTLVRNENARLKELMEVGVNRVSTIITELRRELKVVKDLTSDIADLPSVQAITPPSGSTAGGDQVTITGFNFQKVKKVIFGGIEIEVDDSDINNDGTSITVITPAHDEGVVAVKVETDEASDTLTDGFTYERTPPPVAVPVVKLISPNVGPISGRQQVAIIGLNLSQVTNVTFGPTNAAIILQRDPDGHFVQVETPVGPQGGQVDVVISYPGDAITVSKGYFFEG